MSSTPAWRDRLAHVNSALLAALFFLIPTQIAAVHVLTAVILILWLVEGRWPEKWQALRSNPVFWVFQAYFWWVVVSLLWTTQMAEGRRMVSSYLFFLLSALYFTVVRREHTGRYLAAFAAGVVMCEVLATYNWLHLHHFPHWPNGVRAQKDPMEIGPFVDRILFGPALAFAGYIGAWQATLSTGRTRVIWAGTTLTAFVVLSVSASRVGMISFSLMMTLLALQKLAHRKGMALLGASAVLVGCVLGLYALSDANTKDRIGQIFSESHQLDTAVNESIPLRHLYVINTWQIIKQHPWLGVGAGDFTAEYKVVNDQRSPAWQPTRNPHNQMLFNLVTTGVFGGLLLLSTWAAPPWFARHWPDDGLRSLRLALPVFYFFICLSESYIWRSNTGLMFMLFSTLLYGPGPIAPRTASPGDS